MHHRVWRRRFINMYNSVAPWPRLFQRNNSSTTSDTSATLNYANLRFISNTVSIRVWLFLNAPEEGAKRRAYSMKGLYRS